LAFVATALTVAGILIGIGFSASSTAGDDPDPWFVVGAWVGGAAIFALVMAFVIWPALQRLPRLRRAIRGPETDASGVPAAVGVIRATYGSGETRWDVTEKVLPLMRDGKLDFKVGNEHFGDPTPNVAKDFRLRYTLDDQRRDGIWQEDEQVRLP
jgi:hypothetical protein